MRPLRRQVPPGAYETYLGIKLRGKPTSEQQTTLYAILDREERVVEAAKPKVEPPPTPRPHRFVPGPADPAFVARILHVRSCDCRYCVEARYGRRFS